MCLCLCSGDADDFCGYMLFLPGHLHPFWSNSRCPFCRKFPRKEVDVRLLVTFLIMFVFQKYAADQFQKLCQPGIRVPVLGIALIAFAALSLQGFMLDPRNGSSPLLPVLGIGSLTANSSSTSEEIGETITPNDPNNYAPPIRQEQNSGAPAAGDKDEHHSETGERDEEPDDLDDLDAEESQDDDELSIDLGNGVRIKKVKDPHGGYLTLEKSVDAGNISSVGVDEEPGIGFRSASGKGGRTNSSLGWNKASELDNSSLAPSVASHPVSSYIDKGTQDKQGSKPDDSAVNIVASISSTGEGKRETNRTVATSEERKTLQSGAAMPNCRLSREHAVKEREKKKVAVAMSEMYRMLLKNRGSSCSTIPRWSSPSDQQILEAQRQIADAPIVESDTELYSPVFRNVSVFKRSYELMEKMLKVYIYKEGEQPVFHQPPLTGIYASEGWFMKHMEASRHYFVDDPRKAHLFYMPFSSSLLRFQLYIPGSHNHRNLVEHLKNYVGTIAGKYPFWNRTGGADHFLAACHDWATDETARAMGNSIRALCNADITEGFELGKDVSLPETNVRSGQDPLRDLGGRPTRKRPFLAFFAGQMHGYLRPVLLQHWGNGDPDMKVSGPLPQRGGRRRKKTAAYAQYMKSSRYCICPRGYEVNSPRVVEAISYGCVPVIISDNFVPPFFEVLNWEAFSVVVAERDVPRLKEILVSMPRKRYLALQTGVRKVRQHFLWHIRPEKYDLFHMILHSVWLNRVLSFHAAG